MRFSLLRLGGDRDHENLAVSGGQAVANIDARLHAHDPSRSQGARRRQHVFDLADRVTVMKNGRVVATRATASVTKDEVLEMIILGRIPHESEARRDDIGQTR